MKFEMTKDEEVATRMPRGRFFVMTPDGEFARRNSYNKATRFAFERKGDAMLRVTSRADGTYVFDVKTKERLALTVSHDDHQTRIALIKRVLIELAHAPPTAALEADMNALERWITELGGDARTGAHYAIKKGKSDVNRTD